MSDISSHHVYQRAWDEGSTCFTAFDQESWTQDHEAEKRLVSVNPGGSVNRIPRNLVLILFHDASVLDDEMVLDCLDTSPMVSALDRREGMGVMAGLSGTCRC